MILRRFMKHVTDQNWFAVGLDVLVVITGIFLGMQVTEWNEVRKEKTQERAFLLRMEHELNLMISINEQELQKGEIAHNKTREVIVMLQEGLMYNEHRQAFGEKLTGFDSFPAAKVQNTVITEMISSGKLGIIQSNDLRQAIVEFNQASDDMRRNNEAHFSIFLQTRDDLHQYVKLSADSLDLATNKDAIDGSWQVLNFDQNAASAGKLRFIYEFTSAQLDQVEGFIIQAKELHLKIQKAL